MTDPPDSGSAQDDELLEALREAVSAGDAVPPAVLEAARAALGWRRLDAELAELVEDSATGERELAGVRGGTGPRLLTFEGAGASIEVEVEVHESGTARRLVSQVVPAQPVTVEIRHASGITLQLGSDDLGRFAAEVARGPVSLHLLLPDGRAVDTEWVAI